MMFENIIGNENNKKLFQDIIKENKIANAYMFIGRESIGKMLFAMEFAKAILCIGQEKPCNTCKSCIEFDSSNNPDFFTINPEGNAIKIDTIREVVKKVYEKPIVSKRKVYIINDSNLMTKEAQNSLLKTLEEPPEYVTIILITTDDNLFLPTVKSRCTKILFNKLNNDQLLKILENKFNCKGVSDLTLKIADGSIKKALILKDKEKDYKLIDNLFSNIEKFDIIDMLEKKEDIFVDKEEAIEILEYINLIFFNKVKTNTKYINCMEIVEDTKNRIKKSNNFDMAIDHFMITVWEEING